MATFCALGPDSPARSGAPTRCASSGSWTPTWPTSPLARSARSSSGPDPLVRLLEPARGQRGTHARRLVHTTDLGRRTPDGSIVFVGSALRLIKSGSENIYPAEVEACLEHIRP